jgi:hypothetical protein
LRGVTGRRPDSAGHPGPWVALRCRCTLAMRRRRTRRQPDNPIERVSRIGWIWDLRKAEGRLEHGRLEVAPDLALDLGGYLRRTKSAATHLILQRLNASAARPQLQRGVAVGWAAFGPWSRRSVRRSSSRGYRALLAAARQQQGACHDGRQQDGPHPISHGFTASSRSFRSWERRSGPGDADGAGRSDGGSAAPWI